MTAWSQTEHGMVADGLGDEDPTDLVIKNCTTEVQTDNHQQKFNR